MGLLATSGSFGRDLGRFLLRLHFMFGAGGWIWGKSSTFLSQCRASAWLASCRLGWAGLETFFDLRINYYYQCV